MKKHHYKTTVNWTGNKGNGTLSPNFNRDHTISCQGKYAEISGSSDPAFSGDPTRYNPEDLFLSSISACHMLCYLHLCSVNNIEVITYTDHATGIMEETTKGSGKFLEVMLHPMVKISNPDMVDKANDLHHAAHEMCFIANSCNFKIEHSPNTTTT
ncbi:MULTISPECIES: OsmC family protein [Arenibacter]|uniref:OsmC family protein n=1 Tax=Arenibacter TaxID=178469 RepID=UPI000A3B90A6|nr:MULTISPECIES: OsmC family protein [Arenibacter]